MHERPVFGKMVGLSAVVQQLGFEKKTSPIIKVDIHIHTTIIMERRRAREQVNTVAKSSIEYTVMRSYRLAVEEIFSDGEVNCGRLYVLRLFTNAMIRGYPLYEDAIRREHELLKTSLVCQCESWRWTRVLNTVTGMFTRNTSV